MILPSATSHRFPGGRVLRRTFPGAPLQWLEFSCNSLPSEGPRPPPSPTAGRSWGVSPHQHPPALRATRGQDGAPPAPSQPCWRSPSPGARGATLPQPLSPGRTGVPAPCCALRLRHGRRRVMPSIQTEGWPAAPAAPARPCAGVTSPPSSPPAAQRQDPSGGTAHAARGCPRSCHRSAARHRAPHSRPRQGPPAPGAGAQPPERRRAAGPLLLPAPAASWHAGCGDAARAAASRGNFCGPLPRAVHGSTTRRCKHTGEKEKSPRSLEHSDNSK